MNFSYKQYQAVRGILPLVSSTEYNVFQGTASTNTWFLLWLNEPPVGTRRDLLIHSPVDAHGGCFPLSGLVSRAAGNTSGPALLERLRSSPWLGRLAEWAQ